MKLTKYLALIVGLTLTTAAQAKTFELDGAHSNVGFKIRHLLTYVTGKFTEFSGHFETDESGNLIKAETIVKASSIDTANKKRDEHLRSDDFFDVKKFAELKFTSDKFKIKKGGSGKMPGQLTIHGVTKPVNFDVEYFGEIEGPGGKMKAGATATAKINRKDFGLTWTQTLETGGVLVGDEVTIQIDIEGNEIIAPNVAKDTKNLPAKVTAAEKAPAKK